MTNPNDPASSRAMFTASDSTPKNHWSTDLGAPGLTKRELFAALAMNGILAKGFTSLTGNNDLLIPGLVASEATDHADALIAALNQGAE